MGDLLHIRHGWHTQRKLGYPGRFAEGRQELCGHETIRHLRGSRNLIPGANVTLTVADNSANGRTDVTIAASGGSSSSGLQRDFYAAACQSASASLAWNVLSASAPVPDCAIGANGAVYGVAKFSNSSAQAMQQSLDLPSSVSTVSFDFAWRARAAGGNVIWQIRYLIAAADGTASDDPDITGSGTTVQASAVAAATATLLHSTISISPSGAAGKRIYFIAFRDHTTAGDTFTDATYMPELAKVTVRVQ
jgi:hypothetical protein